MTFRLLFLSRAALIIRPAVSPSSVTPLALDAPNPYTIAMVRSRIVRSDHFNEGMLDTVESQTFKRNRYNWCMAEPQASASG